MTNKKLHIGKGLDFPLELITDRSMILATTGAGKTFAMRVMAEEALDAGQQVVILDPKGDFWGLRSSEDGKTPGYPIPVFGGEHADLPLEDGSGEFIAELIVKERLSAILDMSLFSKTKMHAWATEFAEAFYHRNREAMLLLVDEVHTFAPQKFSGKERMLGAFTDLWGKGRKRGIGVIGASQRSALVNKDVLDLTGTMFFLRTSGPRDRDVVAKWLDYNAPADVMSEILTSLPGLDNGEVWVYSPHTFKMLKRGRVRFTTTFDSSATPKPGQAIRKPKTLAEIDVGSVTEQMSSAIERAKADDPKELRKQLAALKRELAQKPKVQERPVEVEKPVEVPVPVLDLEALDEIGGRLEEAWSVLEPLAGLQKTVAESVAEARKLLAVPVSRPQVREQNVKRAPRPAPPVRSDIPRSNIPVDVTPSEGLTGPEQRVLDSLGWWEAVGVDVPTKIQVGFIAGYRVGKKVGGTYGNVLGQLRSKGLIDYPRQGSVALTTEGRNLFNPLHIDPTEEALQAAIMERLDNPERRVLAGAIEVYPDSISKIDLGERAGYTVGGKVGGTYGNILGRLRSLGLIDYPQQGHVVATSTLFLDA